MIIADHPDCPQREWVYPSRSPSTFEPRFIGFWSTVFCDPRTGIVVKQGPDFDRGEYLRLPIPGDFMDPEWLEEDRVMVLRHLRGGVLIRIGRPRRCRFGCSPEIVHLGCRELTDGVFVWPEGLAHYVESHDVRPPEEFVQHVRWFDIP